MWKSHCKMLRIRRKTDYIEHFFCEIATHVGNAFMHSAKADKSVLYWFRNDTGF